MSDIFFERAQIQYENRMPSEPKHVGDFYVGDKFEIVNPFFRDMPEEDGSSNYGTVSGFDCGEIVGCCGYREFIFYPEDLKKIY